MCKSNICADASIHADEVLKLLASKDLFTRRSNRTQLAECLSLKLVPAN
jgi:hypothetical protein